MCRGQHCCQSRPTLLPIEHLACYQMCRPFKGPGSRSTAGWPGCKRPNRVDPTLAARLADGCKPTSVGRPSANYTEVHASIRSFWPPLESYRCCSCSHCAKPHVFALRARHLGMQSGAPTVAASVSCSGAARQLPPPQRRQRPLLAACCSPPSEPCGPLQQQLGLPPWRSLLTALGIALLWCGAAVAYVWQARVEVGVGMPCHRCACPLGCCTIVVPMLQARQQAQAAAHELCFRILAAFSLFWMCC